MALAGAKCMAVLATHGGGAHLSTSVDARQRPGSLLASACPPRLCCSDAIAAGERWTVYPLGPRGSVKTFCEHEWMNENVRDIEARVYRGARVPGPRGPRAGRLWHECEMRGAPGASKRECSRARLLECW